jgi:alpha-L-fucosidase
MMKQRNSLRSVETSVPCLGADPACNFRKWMVTVTVFTAVAVCSSVRGQETPVEPIKSSVRAGGTKDKVGTKPPPVDPYAKETKEERDARMAWWREARFGMFIHWGVYAALAGDKLAIKTGWGSEWIAHQNRIPLAKYRDYARTFNPTNYNPEVWVLLAKKAGMKYMVITAKHHDGFALFDSKVTDWDVVDATAYKKDLLKPLAEACRKHGMKLGFYYSQAQDWMHPGGAVKVVRGKGSIWDEAQKGDMDEYIRKIAVPQVRELLTNYGDIAVFWWDTPTGMNPARANMLLPLLRLQPGIIHNNRLCLGSSGDYSTPENKVPGASVKDSDWETCMTMNTTWGYKSYDHEWKSAKTLIQTLCDIASKNGNFLLNVGPKDDGTIPKESVDALEAMGDWLKVNVEAIYGTSASPLSSQPQGARVTCKRQGDATSLYIHIFEWPADGKLSLAADGAITEASVLGHPDVKVTTTPAIVGTDIVLAGPQPDPNCSVVKLVFKGRMEASGALVQSDKDGKFNLAAGDATIHAATRGMQVTGNRLFTGWQSPDDYPEWKIDLKQPGTYRVQAQIATQNKATLTIIVKNKVTGKETSVPVTLPNTGSKRPDKVQPADLGELTLDEPGLISFTLKPNPEGWKEASPSLGDLTMVPAK